MAAQILDFAVRHYIKIYETGKSKILRTMHYEIEVTRDPQDLLDEEKEVLSDMFNGLLPKVGDKIKIRKNCRIICHILDVHLMMRVIYLT